MKTSVKTLLACLLFPTLLIGQKMQEKPVWQFDLHFDFAKADLKTEYQPRLDSLVVALQDSTFVVSMTANILVTSRKQLSLIPIINDKA